MLNSEEIKIAI